MNYRYKTNDGTIVDTRQTTASYKGKYSKGRTSEILYHDPIGGYYLVDRVNQSVEWYCDELAIAWFEKNGLYDLPANLIGGVKQGDAVKRLEAAYARNIILVADNDEKDRNGVQLAQAIEVLEAERNDLRIERDTAIDQRDDARRKFCQVLAVCNFTSPALEAKISEWSYLY